MNDLTSIDPNAVIAESATQALVRSGKSAGVRGLAERRKGPVPTRPGNDRIAPRAGRRTPLRQTRALSDTTARARRVQPQLPLRAVEPVDVVGVMSTEPVANAPVPQSQAGSGQVRLTRRGRVVLFVTGLVATLVAMVVLASMAVAGSGAKQSEQTRVVTVSSGQSLTTIAAPLAGPGEIADVIAEIRELNDLDTATLQPGQQLRVPIR